ncbi:MAG: diguanylate cyclase, partial [Rhizorhabdus sp.]|nr:diguanylate cyclase [Rhizorhabdus sp.]
HAEGDRCLIEVTTAIKAALRKDGTICRMAGDEFVLLLPDCAQAQAALILNRVQEAVERSEWPIGVSTGAVVVPPGSKSGAEAIISAADRIMYRVKQGRNGQAIESLQAA